MTRTTLEKPVFVALTALCFVLESRLELFGISPALTVLPVYYVGLRYGPLKGCLAGALIGAIADSLAGHLLGPEMLAMGTVGILASVLTGGFLRWTPLLGVIGLFVITWAGGVISYASLSAFAEAPTSLSNAATALLVQGTINAVAGVFIRSADDH
jgi:rod shape-determining protein MreD